MQKIDELYDRYKIMPGLQAHQMRVAAVGKMICDHFHSDIDSDTVVVACLFHDMGNIIKADLSVLPHLLEPQGFEYWQEVKRGYHERYGDDENAATRIIVKEIGIPERAQEMIAKMGFSMMESVVEGGPIELQVLEYADMRVGPDGVLSLESRLAEGRARYKQRKNELGGDYGDERYERFVHAAHQLEDLVIPKCDLQPERITDAAIVQNLESLRDYTIG